MALVEVIFNGISYNIHCNGNEKMNEICQRFETKLGTKKNLFYLFNGDKIKMDLTFEQLIKEKDKSNNKIKLLSYEFDNGDDNLVVKENLFLKSMNLYKSGEFQYELSNAKIDIGQALKDLNIQPYQKIKITLKRGIYQWNEYYRMPIRSELLLYGDTEGKNFDGGKKNIVKILINKECKCDGKKMFRQDDIYLFADTSGNISCKLIITTDSSADIQFIDFIESTNRTSVNPHFIGGVFELDGDNSRLYFAQTQAEISNTPFIHLHDWAVSRIIFGYTHLTKFPESKNDKIEIISTAHAYGWGGSKAIVNKTHLFFNDDFFFDTKNNHIELIEY